MNRRFRLPFSVFRCAALPLLLAGGEPAAFANGGAAAAPPPDQAIEGFYLQTADSGTAERRADGTYAIVLRDVPPHVLFFGDAAGTAATVPAGSFLGGGTAGETPEEARATLRIGEQAFELDVSESRYDAAARELHFVAKAAEPATGAALPGEFSDPRLVVGAQRVYCRDGGVTCHWVVQECRRWFDRPVTCQEFGQVISDTVLGSVGWGRSYCACDAFCRNSDPRAPCGTERMIIDYFCNKQYGHQDCPGDNFCSWKGTNVRYATWRCNRCCGELCGIFRPC